MIPPVLLHGAAASAARRARPSAPKGDDRGQGAGYAARLGILLVVLALLGAVLAIAWHGLPASRRAPPVVEEAAIEPMVRGALEDVGAASSVEVKLAHAETRFWKRRYDELSAVATATLPPERVGPFLRAIGDSLQRRLVERKATLRNVTATQWPDSLDPARPAAPARLSLPFATRGRVGWVTVEVVEAAGRLTLWLTIHEGPKPSDD